jgi:hypothetical protein
LIRKRFGTSAPLYHRRHYNSRGQLFDVRLGTDGAAINDGPNPAQWTGASWNRGALRMFFSSNLIECAWPAVASQQNNGNLYRQDHFVPTALEGDGNVTGWVMSADYYCYDSLNRVAQTAEETYTSTGGCAPNVFNCWTEPSSTKAVLSTCLAKHCNGCVDNARDPKRQQRAGS